MLKSARVSDIMRAMPNDNSLANLNKGRTRLFTTELALQVLNARRDAFPEPMTTARFVQIAVAEGALPRAPHVSTIQRLISGKLFPKLLDPTTGLVYDYSKVPKFERGRPFTVHRAIDEHTGLPVKPLSKAKAELKRQLLLEVGQRTAESVAIAIRETREALAHGSVQLGRDLFELKEQVAQLRNQVAKLEGSI